MFKKLLIFSSILLPLVCIGQSNVSIKSIQKISNTSGGLGNVLSTEGRFANRVTNIGDLNGDGVLDVAVGEEYADDGGTDKGAVWILFLKSDGSVKSKQKISETSGNLGLTLSSGTRFGFSVANIGDLNGDGITDLAVGSVVENWYAGTVWVLFMKSDGTVKSTKKIEGNTTNFTSLDTYDGFAHDITGPGDMNGDGVNDLIVGAFRDDDGGYDKGAVYIIFLKNDGSVKGYKKISNTTGSFSATLDNEDLFGGAVAALGDIDGDGNKDIAVGAFYDDDNATDAGAVYILNLKADCSVKSFKKISNKTTGFSNVLAYNDLFGRAISETSDLNGDGVKDLLVGALQDNGNGSQRGAVYIIYLDSNQGVKSYQKFSSKTSTLSSYLNDVDKFGGSLANLNGYTQGETAFATGAIFDDDGTLDAGALYIVNLKTPGVPDLVISRLIFTGDSICADTSANVTAIIKNKGNASINNPVIYFSYKSGNTIISRSFIYPGSISAGDSVSYNIKLNLQNGGNIDVTAYVSNIKDTVLSNDTIKVSLNIIYLQPKFAATNACLGNNVAFTNTSTYVGVNSVNYLWDFGDSTTSTAKDPVHKYSAPGTYSVLLTVYTQNCTKTYVSSVTVYALPSISFSTSSGCVGSAVSFTAQVDLHGNSLKSITWDFGDQSFDSTSSTNHVYTNDGIYMVKLKVISDKGCVAEYSKAVSIGSLPQAGHTRSNDTLFANDLSAASYQWYKNGFALPGETNNFYVLSASGNYTVLVTSTGGCKDSAQSKFENYSTVGINTFTEKSVAEIKLYPNPGYGIYYIGLKENSGTGHLNITTVEGKVVHQQILQAGQNKINITHLTPAIYVVQVQQGNSLYTTRLIKN